MLPDDNFAIVLKKAAVVIET